ncbi:hypothetical protein TrLO_g5362 [Triparma laevis f. longispina]|uniref:Uncharacterized protein n=1 Tax=Triparma laevis f. longispina TaxID=1714387 RepID=A0A9W7E3R5_9STRA|nr:hypothetical protein TrLO_g5362 [Triparma laevis f. longispina]
MWLALATAITFCSGFMLTVFFHNLGSPNLPSNSKIHLPSPSLLEKLSHNKNLKYHIPIQAFESSLIPEDVREKTHVEEERDELEKFSHQKPEPVKPVWDGKLRTKEEAEALLEEERKKQLDVTSDCAAKDQNKVRRFKVGKRKDFQSSIADALHTLDMCKNDKEHKGYDFYWDETFDQTADSKEKKKYLNSNINKGALVSSIPGAREAIGLKPSLARVHNMCLKDLSPSQCAFTKRAFNFKREKDKLHIEDGTRRFLDFANDLIYEQMAQEDWPQLWIFKPQKSFLGQGIKLLKVHEKDVMDKSGISHWASSRFPSGEWTLQEYVRNPALFKGRKFDVRVWSVLMSTEPLRIYTLGHGFPKVSTKDYNPSAEFFEDLCMHIKMPLGPGCKAKHLVRPYPKSTEGDTWTKGLEFREGEKGGHWPSMWTQIEDQVSVVVVSGLSKMKFAEHGIFQDDPKKKDDYRRFVFLSPDFAMDDTGKVFMEEMNTNGFMIGDTYSTFFPAQEQTVTVMRMLGADGFPDSWKYEGSAEETIGAFCAADFSVRCDEKVKEELRRLIDEEMHAEMWKRSFPPREDSWPGLSNVKSFWNKYSRLMKSELDEENASETVDDGKLYEPTKLDLATWKFIEWRKDVSVGGEEDEESVKLRKIVKRTCKYCNVVVTEEEKSTDERVWFG